MINFLENFSSLHFFLFSNRFMTDSEDRTGPAPWIASSQEVPLRGPQITPSQSRPSSSQGRPGGSSSLLSSSVGGAGASRGRLSLAHPGEHGLLTPGAGLNVASASPGRSSTDEYARIIVQSRNAKMQKWKANSQRTGSSPPPTSGYFMPQSQDNRPRFDRSSSQEAGILSADDNFLVRAGPPSGSTLNRRDTAIGLSGLRHSPLASSSPKGNADSNAADSSGQFPNFSQTAGGSDFGSPNLGSDGDGSREIEWVDWLDEYRKMKEAKLRSELEESEREAEEEVEALTQVASKLDLNKDEEERRDSVEAASKPQETSSSSSTATRLPTPKGHELGMRRPSQPPQKRPTPPSTAASANDSRRSLSLASGQRSDFLSSSLGPSSGAAAMAAHSQAMGSSPIKRSSVIQDTKNRTISLSPYTSRIASTSSATSTASGVTGSGKKKRNLGGKIEAWWSAVKTGFGAPNAEAVYGKGRQQPPFRMPVTPSSSERPSHSPRSSPRRDHSSPRLGGANEKNKGDLPTLSSSFAGMSFGSPHSRSQTGGHANPAASNQSVHTLRAASSVQDLSAAVKDQGSSDTETGVATGSSLVDVDHQSHLGAPSKEPRASSSSKGSDETTSAGGRKRQHPHLSLNLEKGLSSFDAGAFEGLGSGRHTPSSRSGPSSSDRGPLSAASSRSPLSATNFKGDTMQQQQQEPPSPRDTRRLSRAWNPTSIHPGSENKVVTPVEEDRQSQSSPVPRDSSTSRRPGGNALSSKDITINSIRHHIRHRLAASKESCDKELRKIVVAINLFVEESIQAREEAAFNELEHSQSTDDLDQIFGSSDQLGPALGLNPTGESGGVPLARNNSAPLAGPTGSSQLVSDDGAVDPDETPQDISAGGIGSMDSDALRLGGEYRLPTPPTTSRDSVQAARVPSGPRSGNVNTLTQSRSRNFSRSGSAANSRSTSRSHSPMLTAVNSALSVPTDSPQLSPARRTRALLAEDAPPEPYIPALEEIVTLAMDVLDTSIHALTSRSGACSEVISNIQTVGTAWDDHPDWPGRGWYVQLLLAVAGLSRVVEWWEAEKGFWNFDDESEQQDAEPIQFIMHGQGGGVGNDDAHELRAFQQAHLSGSVAGSPVRPKAPPLPPLDPPVPSSSSSFGSPALEPRDRRAVSEGGDRSRLAAAAAAEEEIESQPLEPVDEVQDAKRQGEEAKDTPNVLMELSVDEERFLYLSPAWKTVVG